MPILPRDAALFNANRQRRTPRISFVAQSGTTIIAVTFNRRMDRTKTTSRIRTYDPVTGVIDWNGATWFSDYSFLTSSRTIVSGSFTGTRRAIYLSGNLRAKGRFRVNARERCDSVENI